MGSNLALQLAIKIALAAACKFFGICFELCPDGVCSEDTRNKLFAALDAVQDQERPVSADPSKAQAFGFDIDWSVFEELVQCGTNCARLLLQFLGLTPKVG